ncbi:MAG: hypothetical protein ACKVU2_08810 [Saprospiraceae bacterium]
MDKEALIQLLANNQLDELIYALKNQHGVYNDLVLLESQWNDLRAQERNGIIASGQAGIEHAKIRKNLLELIEIATGNRRSIPNAPAPTARSSNRAMILGAAAVVLVLFLYLTYSIFAPSDAETTSQTTNTQTAPVEQAPKPQSAKPGKLDISQAQPITMAPGDFQYERVYSIVKTSVESTGGGKSLITLTVGLNFKGIINAVLGTEKFRLVADELPGPIAPSNFLSTIVDSKSYGEGDIKFELSDNISRFSVILEGKEDKKWVFSR